MTETPESNAPDAQQNTDEAPTDSGDSLSSKGSPGNLTSGKSSVTFDEALVLDRRLGEFVLAIGFFTRLPVPLDEETAARPLADASWAFPIAGLIIGLCGSAAIALGIGLNLPPLVLAFLTISLMVCLTGALHEDGLSDCADVLWSGKDSKERLITMRDSRIGAFGVIALVLMLGLKAAAIAHLLTIEGMWNTVLATLAAASLSRGFLPCIMRLAPLATEKGRAADAGNPSQQYMLIAAGLSVLICLLCLGFGTTALSLFIGGGLCAALTVIAINRIGGYNGDVLGAQQQILDVTTLTIASAIF